MRLTDRKALWLVVFVSGVIAAVYLLLRRDLFVGGNYLFADFGFYLFGIDAVLRGETPFRDFAWQYGPLPLFLHGATAKLFGNTALVYLFTQAAVMVANIGLAFHLLRRALAMRETLLAMGFVVAPYFLRQVAGAVIYFPLEITMLLLVALFWRPPVARTLGDAVRLGAALGLMQWVKFGGAFVAGLAILILDLAVIHFRSWPRVELWGWMRRSLVTLGVFVAVEACLAGVVLFWAPGYIGMDVLWPWYMTAHYQSGEVLAERYPAYETMGLLLGTQLPGLVWLGLAVALTILLLKGRINTEQVVVVAPLAFFGLFYGVGLMIYFKHKWLIYQYFCLLCVPACWMFWRLAGTWRYGLAGLLLPAFLALPYKMLWQKSGTQAVEMPNRQALWLTLDEKRRAEAIFAGLAAVPDQPGARDPIMVFGGFGGSFHFFGNYPHAARHVWFLPAFLRTYEEGMVFGSVARTKALLVFTAASTVREMTDDPKTWKVEQWSPFPRSRDAALAGKLLSPIKVDERWVVFPVKR